MTGLPEKQHDSPSRITTAAVPPPRPVPPPPASIYRPHGIGLRVSYQCLIGCRHCYQKSEPGKDVCFDKDRLMGVLKEGRDAGLSNVGFSGGEPFLQAETVFEGIRTARDLGYKGAIGVVTNGFWGKSHRSAETVIRKLADAGFSPPNGRMNISVGEFHQEWIPVDTIGHVVAAHWEHFEQPVNLLVTFSKGNGGIFQRLRDHLANRGIPEKSYLYQIYSSIAHVGRAHEVLAADTNPEIPVSRYGSCGGINRFSIEPSGKVAPCCGFNRFTNGLFMGNLYEHTVSEIIDRTNRSIVFQYLKYKDLRDIHALLSERFDLKSGYRHKCELCEALFNNKAHVAYLEEIATRVLGDRLRADSLAEGTKFFREAEPAPVKVLPPRQAKPKSEPAATPSGATPDVNELLRRLRKLEEENALLRQNYEDAVLGLPAVARHGSADAGGTGE